MDGYPLRYFIFAKRYVNRDLAIKLEAMRLEHNELADRTLRRLANQQVRS